ncbi:hypothetical protein [Sorangium sp. So ce854]|uniref:hypothetical protein n=1 Tax=Sorangium sp. So ce854 TaxID=3133322 RepID=UPI003F62A202
MVRHPTPPEVRDGVKSLVEGCHVVDQAFALKHDKQPTRSWRRGRSQPSYNRSHRALSSDVSHVGPFSSASATRLGPIDRLRVQRPSRWLAR